MFEQAVDRGARRPRPARSPGVPYLLKDLACEMEGVRVHRRARRSCADHVSALRPASWSPGCARPGLVILGKTNTPEFGMAPDLRAGAVRPDPQPLGPRAVHQRIERRLGRRGGVGHGAVRARQRPGRLAALPGLGLRAVRAQADPRPATRSGPSTATWPAAARSNTPSPARCATARRCSTPRPARRSATRTGRRRRRDRSLRRGRDATPAGCASRYTARTPDGDLGHPDCVAAARRTPSGCAPSLGHELAEADLARLRRPRSAHAIGTIIDARRRRGSCATGSAASAATRTPTRSNR